ncbi:MAG TPA: hypothetical protein PLE74_05230 [Candidatus Cloacimonadota bacterium]|nr:hypothetical protein [Candidatus Cloacimonadota bacterium]HPT71664.1 hypothetical protein [Candidatus Cloacimonadota bacterium]
MKRIFCLTLLLWITVSLLAWDGSIGFIPKAKAVFEDGHSLEGYFDLNIYGEYREAIALMEPVFERIREGKLPSNEDIRSYFDTKDPKQRRHTVTYAPRSVSINGNAFVIEEEEEQLDFDKIKHFYIIGPDLFEYYVQTVSLANYELFQKSDLLVFTDSGIAGRFNPNLPKNEFYFYASLYSCKQTGSTNLQIISRYFDLESENKLLDSLTTMAGKLDVRDVPIVMAALGEVKNEMQSWLPLLASSQLIRKEDTPPLQQELMSAIENCTLLQRFWNQSIQNGRIDMNQLPLKLHQLVADYNYHSTNEEMADVFRFVMTRIIQLPHYQDWNNLDDALHEKGIVVVEIVWD